MELALTEAKLSGQDVPVGALVIGPDGKVLAHGHNTREVASDPTGHAEITAIRKAAEALGDWRLEHCTLVVTLEPCVMCAGAIVAARIPRIIFGAWDEKVGAAGSLYDLVRDARLGNPVEVIGGILEEECSAQLRTFFSERRISGSK